MTTARPTTLCHPCIGEQVYCTSTLHHHKRESQMCRPDEYPPYPAPTPPPLPSVWWLLYHGLMPADEPRDTSTDVTDEQVLELIG